MAASVKESLEDLTTCPICCEQYQDPRVLDCLHTYCKHCMERLFAETTTICCPECRKEVEIQDVNELKVNFQMNKLISVLETIAKKSSLCQKHEDEVLKRFCETCDQLICCECAIVDHKGHQHDFFGEITKKRKVWLEKGIGIGNATKEKVNAVLTNVHDMQETVNENSGNVEKEIDDAINQQIQALEEKRSILKQQLKDVVKSENLATQEDDLVMHLTILESAIDFIRNVLNRGSDIQIVSLTKQVIAQLFEVVEQPLYTDINVATARLRIDSEMLRENIKHFAEVIDFSRIPCQEAASGRALERNTSTRKSWLRKGRRAAASSLPPPSPPNLQSNSQPNPPPTPPPDAPRNLPPNFRSRPFPRPNSCSPQ